MIRFLKKIRDGVDQQRPKQRLLNRYDWATVGLVFLVAIIVYTITCARYVTGEDSGELIAAAYTGGVSHPPGYPLWCIMARLFLYLPIGDEAFRVAWMSAFFGACTAAIIALIVLRVVDSKTRFGFAIASSLGFAFLRDQWSQAVIAEVYTLNTFLLAMAMWASIEWWAERKTKWLITTGIVLGLGLSNHHTILALVVGFGPFLLIAARSIGEVLRYAGLFAGALLIGLLPYAYLPIAGASDSPVIWGDPTTWQGFVDHVSREQYKNSDAIVVEQDSKRFKAQVGVLIDHAKGQGNSALLILGALLLVLSIRRNFFVFTILAGVAVLTTIGIIWYTNFDLDYENRYVNRLFFVPAYMAICIAFGLFGFRVLSNLREKGQFAVASVAALFMVLPQANLNFADSDYSRYTIVEDYSSALLEELPPEAIAFPSADHATFPLLYQQFVKGKRSDVTIADPFGYVNESILSRLGFDVEDFREAAEDSSWRAAFLAHLIGQTERPIAFTVKKGLPRIQGAQLRHSGFWYLVDRANAVEGADKPKPWDFESASHIRTGQVGLAPADFTAKMIRADLAFAEARESYCRGKKEEARDRLRDSQDDNPESKEHLNNLGSLAAENGDYDSAIELFWKARLLDFDYKTAERNLIIVLRASEKWERVIPLLNKLIREDENNPWVVKEFMAAMAGLKDWKNFVKYGVHHAKLTGQADSAKRAGMVALNELKDQSLANYCFKLGLEMDPNDHTLKILTGQVGKPNRGAPSAAKQNPGLPRMPGRHQSLGNPLAPRTNSRTFGSMTPRVPTPRIPRVNIPGRHQ